MKRLEEQHVEMMAHLSRLDPAMAQQLGADVIKLSEEVVAGADEEVAGNS